MSCLSTTSDPCEVIQHIFCNKNLYGNVVKSIGRSRVARQTGGIYCLYFCNPCDGSDITLRGERILHIFENPCRICWCSPTEKCAGLSIINASFFADVLSSANEALQARSESKLYCKCFKIPHCLFPNVAEKDRCITLTGQQIIKIMCRAMTSGCCITNK
jgi:hypothetical protein